MVSDPIAIFVLFVLLAAFVGILLAGHSTREYALITMPVTCVVVSFFLVGLALLVAAGTDKLFHWTDRAPPRSSTSK